MRFKSIAASTLLVLMLLSTLTPAFAQGNGAVKTTTDNRIVVEFDRRGPMQGLRKINNTDPRLVYALEDSAGHRINPATVRKLDGPLYLPKGITLSLAEYRKFLRAELRTHRHHRKHRRGRKHRHDRKPDIKALISIPSAPAPVVTLASPAVITVQPGEQKTLTVQAIVNGVATNVTAKVIVKGEPTTATAVVTGNSSLISKIVGEKAGGVLSQALGYVMFLVLLLVLVGYSAYVLYRVVPSALRWRRRRRIFGTQTTRTRTTERPLNNRRIFDTETDRTQTRVEEEPLTL